ncbi:MAG: CHAD domain-containing protein [Acidobacteria bacterium]|nr:CHAD domain-containing protein [Acidobacteriota bacterium]MCI0722398.1 CHAD domain-containing protein [Acidobacteriota bacterium]
MLTKAKPALREQRIREFASDMALHFVAVIFANLEGAQSGEVEPLHDMRVATRRLRETLQLFQQFYAPARFKRMLGKVRKTTRILSLPREMDVNLELLRSCELAGGLVVHATCEHLLALFEKEQCRLKRRMLREFDRLELNVLETDLRLLAESAVPPRSKTHRLFAEHQAAEFEVFTQRISQSLLEKARPVIEFVPTREALQRDDRLHELRIRTKKLRYAMEILKPLLPASAGEPPIELCRALQDILGSFHDYAVLIGRLQQHQQEVLQKGLLLLSHGCSRIAAELQEARQSLVPQIEPAYRQLAQALAEYLNPKQETPALPAPA